MDRRDALKQLSMASAAVAVPGISSCPWLEKVPAAPRCRVFLNQVGYLPRAAKVASIAVQNEYPALATRFRVRAMTTNAIVFEGTLTAPALDAASGDMVLQASFTGLDRPGLYQLELPATDAGPSSFNSDSIQIGPDIYANALRLTMRAYYGQRCGCKVDLGGGYAHPSCHLDGAYHASSGRQGSVGNHGGWHDAGDYGRYVVNSGITCGTLLWAWELFPRTLQKLTLDIPESGGKIPDYLAEIRWNLEWMLSMQDDVAKGGDGGVWHKQTSEQFCAFIMPQADHLTSYVIGTGSAPFKSTGATADLASVMAIAARCYGPYDDAFAQRCLVAAEQAYSWAVRNPAVTFTNPPGVGTGGYDDLQLGDELLWAAAELFRTTGKAEYEQAFLAAVSALGPDLKIQAPGWGDVASMGLWTYALSTRATSSHATASEAQQRIRQATNSAAQGLIERGRANGYGNTLGVADYGWGSNSVAGNQSLLLFIDNQFPANPAAVEAALGNLHYLLGRNCHGVSWVTQLGVRPFQHPHHRPSAADGIAAPWPGMLSAGPNARPADKVARTLPKLPPMRMWIDDQGAYSMNEIAINWNAPLVFLLAAANS
jgi:endoglucanase